MLREGFQGFITAIPQYCAMLQTLPSFILDKASEVGSLLPGDLDLARRVKSVQIMYALGLELDSMARITARYSITTEDRFQGRKQEAYPAQRSYQGRAITPMISPGTCSMPQILRNPLLSQFMGLQDSSEVSAERKQTLLICLDFGHVFPLFVYLDPVALGIVRITWYLLLLTLLPNVTVSIKAAQGQLDSIKEHPIHHGVGKLYIGSLSTILRTARGKLEYDL